MSTHEMCKEESDRYAWYLHARMKTVIGRKMTDESEERAISVLADKGILEPDPMDYSNPHIYVQDYKVFMDKVYQVQASKYKDEKPVEKEIRKVEL